MKSLVTSPIILEYTNFTSNSGPLNLNLLSPKIFRGRLRTFLILKFFFIPPCLPRLCCTASELGRKCLVYARVWGLTALYPPFIALKPLPKAYGGSIGFNLSPEEHLLVVDQLSEFSLEVAFLERVQRQFQS